VALQIAPGQLSGEVSDAEIGLNPIMKKLLSRGAIMLIPQSLKKKPTLGATKKKKPK